MRYPGRLIFAAAALLVSLMTAAVSQGVVLPCYFVTTVQCQTVSAATPLPVNASVSASVTGFAPGAAFATLTSTGSSASVALPTGAVVVFHNTGTTAVSCTLGVGSATALVSENIIQPSSWMAFTVGSNTFGACIDQSGSASNVVVLSGGTGLPTGAGGGSGSGGAVTIASGGVASGAIASGAYASGAFASGSFASGSHASGSFASGAFASGSVASGAVASGAIASGAMVDLGSQADTACSTDNGTCSAIALIKRGNQDLTTLNTSVNSAIPAGTNTIGTVGQLPYPVGATPYTATATGTTGATTATLAGASSVTTYLCGFSIRANATAAATGNATVTGVITATMNFTQWTAPNASGLGITEMIFAPCIPASAAATSIAVVSAAPGTGGVVSVSAWGYKL